MEKKQISFENRLAESAKAANSFGNDLPTGAIALKRRTVL